MPHDQPPTAPTSGTDALRRYLDRPFGPPASTGAPLPDEPFADVWREWAAAARRRGAWPVLREVMPQAAFPVRAGIGRSDDYRAATLAGVAPASLPSATGLELPSPDAVELELHPSIAGHVPVVLVRERTTFVALCRALVYRNEPAPIPDAQGAVMVAGWNNWTRIDRLRRAWKARHGTDDPAGWGREMARIRADRTRYQDHIIVVSDGPYSGIAAEHVGLDEATWRARSLALRRAHECTHYYTRRTYGSMRNHVHDELIADWHGLVVAFGRYDADLFLRFMGLEDHPAYRTGARLDIYRGEPPLGGDAFVRLRDLVVRAGRTIERFDRTRPDGPRDAAERARTIRALAAVPVDRLAGDDGLDRLAAAFEAAGRGDA